jgi:hypothetical protein
MEASEAGKKISQQHGSEHQGDDNREHKGDADG